MRVIKTITHQGYRAKIRLSEDGNLHLYVKYYTSSLKEIPEWDDTNLHLKNLLRKVKNWANDYPAYTLWSY